jgi:hypothetical protein
MALISNGKVVDPKFSTTPLIINGDMSVSQRGTSFTSQSGSAYQLDRFKLLASSLGTFTISQSTTVPTGQGFAKSFKMDCTTADASPSASDTLQFVQYIEGQNLQSLKKGTSSAEAVTVSFWVRSNKTGTYTLELFDNDNSRQISKTYTISSADTWEKKIVNFAGDTSGALDNDNALSFAVQWWLGAGSNSTSGTLSQTWTSVTTANRVSSSQVNIADNTDNEWYITGIQMEVGEFDSTSIPTFPFESFTSNLIKCSRYYTEINQNGANGWRTFPGRINGSADVENIGITLPTFLRSGNPTATKSGSCVAQVWDENGYHATSAGGGTFSILTDSGDNTPFLNCKQTGFTGLHNEGAGNVSFVIGTPSIALDAEL